MPEYFVLKDGYNERYCGIYDLPEDFAACDKPADGVKMGNEYRDGQTFRMAREVSGIQIPDLIHNTLHYLMVGERLKTLLEQESRARIEFLRFTILNHKGRVASKECYIANVLEIVDCVDAQRTKGRMDPVNPQWYASIRELHLDRSRIPEEARLFRIASKPSIIVVRDDLRGQMERQGITGAVWHSMGEKVLLR